MRRLKIKIYGYFTEIEKIPKTPRKVLAEIGVISNETLKRSLDNEENS